VTSDGWARERFRAGILASVAAKTALLDDLEPCLAVADAIVQALRAGRTLFFFGNGGSAADSQHIAAEFVGRFYLDRRALPAISLTVNTSIITAIANDLGYERVFARQLEALARPGDVAFGLSTSGGSPNVVAGLATARDLGLITVAMTGAQGGRAADIADHAVRVPATDVPRIQEAHILIGHLWSEIAEAALAGDGD
jgi:D-sedoheptulose 7-phosphate isomerase